MNLNFDKCDETNCISCDNYGNIIKFVAEGKPFNKVKRIKSGAYGSVYQFTHNNNHYAVKHFYSYQSYLEEVGISYLLKNSIYPTYVVPSYPVHTGHCHFVVMHYKTGSLADLLNVSPEKRLQIYNDTIDAIADLYLKGFLYTDLKPANVLCEKDEKENYRIYLADLGGITPIGQEASLTETTADINIRPFIQNDEANLRQILREKVEEEIFRREKKIELIYEPEELINMQTLKKNNSWTPAELNEVMDFVNRTVNDGIKHCIFTYPSIYSPFQKYGKDNVIEIYCNFFHQITAFYLLIVGNKIREIDRRMARIAHDVVVQNFKDENVELSDLNVELSDLKTNLPEHLQTFFLIQKQNLQNKISTKQDVYKLLLLMKIENEVLMEIPILKNKQNETPKKTPMTVFFNQKNPSLEPTKDGKRKAEASPDKATPKKARTDRGAAPSKSTPKETPKETPMNAGSKKRAKRSKDRKTAKVLLQSRSPIMSLE